MMGLAPADRVKLAKMLALLGSDQPGERDAAALAADRLVRARGVAWADLLGGAPPPAGTPEKPWGAASSWTPSGDRHSDLAACNRRPDLLTEWERQFVAGLAGRKSISVRQLEILTELAARVRAAGPRSA